MQNILKQKFKWLHKVVLIQVYQEILGKPWQTMRSLAKPFSFASERRKLIVSQFRCQMLVVIPVFIHQTVQLGGKAA